MDPLAFLETAQKLTAGSPTEADQRTAIGRWYYALFLTLRDGIAKKDEGFRQNMRRGAEDHSRVKRYIQGWRSTSRGEQRTGRREGWSGLYGSLWEARETADYVINGSPATIERLFQQHRVELQRLRQFVVAFVRPP